MKMDEMTKKLKEDKKIKKLMVVAIALLMMGTLLWAALNIEPAEGETTYETGTATLQQVMSGSSSMKDSELKNPIVASDTEPYYPMIATPLALHYSGNSSEPLPLLVYKGKNYEQVIPGVGDSSAVNSFFALYNQTSVMTIGDVTTFSLLPPVHMRIEGSPKKVSLDVATKFWTQSDTAILIQHSQEGYNQAVSVVPMASYLSIPVIVTDAMDDEVAGVLKTLGVKYTIICGEMEGYNKALRFEDYEDIQDSVVKVVREVLGVEPRYITIANPLDVTKREHDPEETLTYHFTGTIQDSTATAYPGAAPEGVDGPIHNYTVPFALADVIYDLKMDVSDATGPPRHMLLPNTPVENNADGSGERLYLYSGVDMDDNGELDQSEASVELRFFGGSPGYDFIRENPDDPTSKPLYAHALIEVPYFYEETPKHLIQLLARLPTDPDTSAEYTLDITVRNLTQPTFPLMPDLSSMAPYQTAFRKGVVLAKPEFQLHSAGYVGCNGCGSPAANEQAVEGANEECLRVKKNLNNLLGRMADMPSKSSDQLVSLAEYYDALPMEEKMYVAVMADTNMVPMYYYPSSGQGDPTEGFGIPSDIYYQDIDADPEDPPYAYGGDGEPYFEIPLGRIDGWDAQDVSALMARTLFYYDILDNHNGAKNTQASLSAEEWKNSGMTSIGSEPPVGAAQTAASKVKKAMQQAGFSVDSTHVNQLSRRQYAAPTYESSNFIYFCAHGFYYWYVPTAQEGLAGITKATGGGGAFDIARVKDFEMGPGILFASSCVTGRIDGVNGRNALSMAFLHAGLNSYIGATRSSWGVLFPIPDAVSGETLGDLLMLHMYAGLTGYLYNKASGLVDGYDIEDATIGYALMNAKNQYIVLDGGADNGGTTCDTFEEFVLHGDPMFNPYEPNHEGAGGA